jgi:MFS family permease
MAESRPAAAADADAANANAEAANDATGLRLEAMAESRQAAAADADAAPPEPYYGADGLTPRSFARVQLALSLGSAIEWYDLAIYGALSPVITPLFFPASDATTASLYFWGVFAVSFIARPIGSLLLGSVGDRWGRRPALLASLAGMALPTLLIGCLPTFAHAGYAAPVLLAVLRAIQGLAMGAEYSTAMMMSVELSPRHRRGLYGSVTFLSGILGVAAANAFVLLLQGALTPEQLSVWGWRLPFLLTSLSAFGGVVLRMHMPEPREWRRACAVEGKEEEEGGKAEEEEHRAPSSRGCFGRRPPPPTAPHAIVEEGVVEDKEEEGGKAEEEHRAPSSHGCFGRRPPPETAPSSSRHRHAHTRGSPVLKLLKQSWPQVALQTFYEAWMSVTFYVFLLWLPTSVLQQQHVMGAARSGGITIAALALMAVAALTGGRCSDLCAKPRRRVAWSTVAIVIGTAAALPGFLALGRATKHAAAAATTTPSATASPLEQASAALFQCGMLVLCGFALGMIPSLCADLYTADHRVVSFSLAHNLAMSLLGGTSPVVVAAMSGTAAGKAGAAAGVYVAAAGGASLLAAAALWVWAPRLFVAVEAVAVEAGEGEVGVEEGKGAAAV